MHFREMPDITNQSTKRKRIALLIHSLQGGGAEKVMSQLANRWCHDHEVHLVTWAAISQDKYMVDPKVVRHGLGRQSTSRGLIAGTWANFKRVQALRRQLKSIQPDYVLSFCDQMNIVAIQAARPLGLPVWIAEHSDPEKQQLSFLWEAWRRRTYPRCTGCVALTRNIAEYMTRWIPSERIRVIPTMLESYPDDVHYQPSVESGLNTLLFVGRLSPEKRVDLLIASWKSIADSLPNWQLTIVGDGPLRGDLEKLAASTQRINLVGWSSEPQQFFSASQLFVMCSRYEGFPVALLEALGFGLPAITTACSSAIAEMQSANFNEFLRVLESDSVESLAEAILELAQDPERCQRMSHQARLVAKHYTWDTIGPLWDSILEP